LIKATVAQSMTWYRAGIYVLGFGATETSFVISATLKMPIGLKQRARRIGIETLRDIRPGGAAMFADVTTGNLVRDALIAERAHQPIEYLGRVALGNGVEDTGFPNVSANIFQKGQRPRQTTDRENQLRGTAILFGVKIGSNIGLASVGLPCRPLGWN
jgi:hypothetical protein